MNLQTIYNISSLVGFAICIYKIQKIETELSILKMSALLNSIAVFAVTNALKTKGIINDNDIESGTSDINGFENE